jgi:hypothetical protein
VFPINDMLIPSWFSPINGLFDANALITMAFGIHGDSSNVDSVVILMDDLYATYSSPATVGVDEDANAGTPVRFALNQNYPNPFNPSTTIRYAVDKSGPVSLKIYDITGRLVTSVLDNVPVDVGEHAVRVDMDRFASGVYMYVLQAGTQRQTKFMTFLK